MSDGRESGRAPPPASYDAIAGFYDEDMGRSAMAPDVGFYLEHCRGVTGWLLELGCGTGRLTLPLLGAGARITGIDTSLPMLRVLRDKARQLPDQSRLRIAAMDMRDLPLQADFAAVLCPYSAFTYLLSDGDRQQALDRVRALSPRGVFLLDVFVPDPAVEALAGQTIFDYRRQLADGTALERHKRLTAVDGSGCRTIVREYRFLDRDGRLLRTVTTSERFHPWPPQQLAERLRAAGFVVEAVFADFAQGPVVNGTKMVAFRCRPALA